MSPWHFTDLPVEIRLEIYRSYFHLEGGLLYSHYSQKLISKDRMERLQLSLMYTCRTIAAETRGLALQFNTITFTTGCHIRDHNRAEQFSEIIYQLAHQRFEVLSYMRPAISDETYDEMTARFPLFKPVLNAIQKYRPWGDFSDGEFIHDISRWGDVPFDAREAVAATCRLALRLMEREAIAAVARYRQNRPQLPYHNDPLSILTLDHSPWVIPSRKKFRRLQTSLYELRPGILSRTQANAWTPAGRRSMPFHFSAAAIALQFLDNMPIWQRMHIRNIVLREDTKSVAFPACHARGFIPFCQQNPRLRVERRVSLFGNVLQIRPGHFTEALRMSDLSNALAAWLVEAMALVPAGMPPDSFHFVLDGDPAPSKAKVVFEKVFQRSLALHLAVEKMYEGSDNAADRSFKPRSEWYILDGFPRAMEELFRNTGILRCNFSPGELGEDGRLPEYPISNSELMAQSQLFFPDDLGFDPRKVIHPSRDFDEDMFGHVEIP